MNKQPLTQVDLQNHASSFITPELIEKAGLFRVSDGEGRALVGNKFLDCSGIAYPVRNPSGQNVAFAVRRDNPEEGENGKLERKYLYEVGFRNNPFYATNTTEKDLHDVEMPLVISEGPKNCLALERMQTEGGLDFRAMSLAGVNSIKTSSYKTTDAQGNRADRKDIIADLLNIKFSDGDKSRVVYICFDSNCRKEVNRNVFYARIKLGQFLRSKGATVRLVDLPQIEGVNGVDDLLAHYEKDLGAKDAIKKVWGLFEKAEVFASATNFIVTDAGVFHKVIGKDKDGNKTIENQFICSKLAIEAQTRDDRGSNWGRLLSWEDNDGRSHTWAMPVAMLSGDGSEVRASLLSEGLLISSQRKAQALLSEYLQTYETFQKITCVPRIGWHNGAYIFPNETITKDEMQEPIVFQSDSFEGEKLTTSGSLQQWREKIARLCVGNSRLSFAVFCAFASVLCGPLEEDGFGVHYRAPSSLGKTTTLLTAGSVFGGSRENGFLDSWKATDNSFEAVAQAHNDGLLCLDEIGECDPFKVASIVYMLGNKTGKGRMNRNAALKKRYSWNILFLSSGEMSLNDILTQTGQKIRGGQGVRLVDIEADAGKGLGLFEDLHEFSTSHELADALRENSKKCYGTAIREFLREIIKRDFADLKKHWHEYKSAFLKSVLPESASGEVKRVATKFALVSFAGELATPITGWTIGEAAKSCKTIFKNWLENQASSSSSSDAENAIKQIRKYIEAHGTSRFEMLTSTGESLDTSKIINRAGLVKKNGEELEYLFLPETFRSEVCKGFDHKFVCKVLSERGFLRHDSAGFQKQLKYGGAQIRPYWISSRILEDPAKTNEEENDEEKAQHADATK